MNSTTDIGNIKLPGGGAAHVIVGKILQYLDGKSYASFIQTSFLKQFDKIFIHNDENIHVLNNIISNEILTKFRKGYLTEYLPTQLGIFMEDLKANFNSDDKDIQKVLDLEIEVLNHFTKAVKEEAQILINGEPEQMVEEGNILHTFEQIKKIVEDRLGMIMTGKEVDLTVFPFSDDCCHLPNCESHHRYGDEYFHQHCHSCGDYQSWKTGILILSYSGLNKDLDKEICVCTGCEDWYYDDGYIDDEGRLQRQRVENNNHENLHLILSNALIKAKKVGKEFSILNNIKTTSEFFKRRNEYIDIYTNTINSSADDLNCGSADNFDFIDDYFDEECEVVLSSTIDG